MWWCDPLEVSWVVLRFSHCAYKFTTNTSVGQCYECLSPEWVINNPADAEDLWIMTTQCLLSPVCRLRFFLSIISAYRYQVHQRVLCVWSAFTPRTQAVSNLDGKLMKLGKFCQLDVLGQFNPDWHLLWWYYIKTLAVFSLIPWAIIHVV